MKMEMGATCFAPAVAAGIPRAASSTARVCSRPSFLGCPCPLTTRVRRSRSCELAIERRTTSASMQYQSSPFSSDGKMEELIHSGISNIEHDHRRNRSGEVSGISLTGDDHWSCPIKRAFSSTVFIIGEMQSFVFRLREELFYQDLEQIIRHVHSDLHASFVWLFQSIFSHTPTLMVYLLIFLANFTVFSMDKNTIFPAAPAVSIVSNVPDSLEQRFSLFDRRIPSSIFDFTGKTASIGGGDGGGKAPVVAGAADHGGDEWSIHGLRRHVSLTAREKRMWEAMVDEAARMTAVDQSTMLGMMSPVKVDLESDDDYSEYLSTELQYHSVVAADSDNPLLLSNFAQFLYLVRHDHDRAEEYFKRAAAVQPADAAAIGLYADFLWKARGNLEAAEEAYLEAIEADPGNTQYAANYAHFLWNTGGEETCFPLDDGDVVSGGQCHGG